MLELIIVLMVMISLLALVWPNLQRPLRRNSLSQAAQTLRGAIDDCRYQAITTGSPVFLQLRQGAGHFRSGSFDSFMNAAGDVGSLANGTPNSTDLPAVAISPAGDSEIAARTNLLAIRKWKLPDSVVVSKVRWTLERSAAEVEEEYASDSATANPPSAAATAGVQTDASIKVGLDQSESEWWLPLAATGQGRDAAIMLLDTSINEEVTVTFASATGALEIAR